MLLFYGTSFHLRYNEESDFAPKAAFFVCENGSCKQIVNTSSKAVAMGVQKPDFIHIGRDAFCDVSKGSCKRIVKTSSKTIEMGCQKPIFLHIGEGCF